MSSAGDFALGSTIDLKFTTIDDTGLPATLAGTPAISAYVDNSTTQITAGITLSVDFDGVTGLHNVRVVASSGNGYAAGTSVALVITTGTVDGVSVVGYVVKEFTIERAAAFARLGAPAGASVSADVAAVKVDTAAILVDTGTTLDGKIDAIDNFLDTEIADIRRAIGPATTTIATLASQTSFTLTAGSADDDAYVGWACMVVDASTAAQTCLGVISAYTGASKTVTLREDPGVFTMATTDIVILLPGKLTDGVSVTEIQASGLADLFNTDSGTTYASAVAGSVVAEIADNAGGSALTEAGIADAVWDEATAGHTTSGTFGEQLKTDVDAILADTNEVQISLAAGGLIESMVDDLQTEVDGIQADTEDIQSRLPAALVNSRMDCTIDGTGMEQGALARFFSGDSGTTYASAVAGSVVKETADNAGGSALTADAIADEVETRTIAAVTVVNGLAANVITAAATAADFTTEIQNGLATAASLATLDGKVDTIDNLLDTEMPALTTAVADLPTNAELATALGTADDAVLAAVATVDTVVDAIKAKTDSLTFTVANVLDANIQRVNDVAVGGTGALGDEWGPV